MCGIYPIFVTYCNDLILITYKTVQFATKLLFLPILPTRCGGLEGQVCQLFFYISRCPAPLRGAGRPEEHRTVSRIPTDDHHG